MRDVLALTLGGSVPWGRTLRPLILSVLICKTGDLVPTLQGDAWKAPAQGGVFDEVADCSFPPGPAAKSPSLPLLC